MKYKLLKEIPWAKIWDIIENIANYGSMIDMSSYPDFFEPIVEKKTYDSLTSWDKVCVILNDCIMEVWFDKIYYRSETFLTHEEAEDEHKRREWAVRKDKFIPNENSDFYFPNANWYILCAEREGWYETIFINLWLAFRTREDCQYAIDNHDLIRLFYTIR